jgi:hypothetical protein
VTSTVHPPEGDIAGASNVFLLAFDYSTKQFKALVSNRPTYILAFIKRGLNVIYTDVDTIWLKDPRSFLNGDYDMEQ